MAMVAMLDLTRRRGAASRAVGGGVGVGRRRPLLLRLSIFAAGILAASLLVVMVLRPSSGLEWGNTYASLEALNILASPDEDEVEEEGGLGRTAETSSHSGGGVAGSSGDESYEVDSGGGDGDGTVDLTPDGRADVTEVSVETTKVDRQNLLGPRRTKAHICYSRVHSEIMAKILRSEMNFTDVDASRTEDWDVIVGGYPHCGKGKRKEGNRHGWDWSMERGLNRMLNERGWDNLKPRQVYHPCMGCADSYCNKRELCRILRDHVDPNYCYVLPEDLDRLKVAMDDGPRSSKKIWVSKIDSSTTHIHTGKGVTFFSSPDDLPTQEQMSNGMHLVQPWNEPYLGKGVFRRKTELRVYVAVTSVYPFRAYAHENMTVVIAAKEYTNSTSAAGDKCMADTHSHTAQCDRYVPSDVKEAIRPMEVENRWLHFGKYADAVGWTEGQRAGLVREALETISVVVRAGLPAMEGHRINRGINASGASCFSHMRVDIGISEDVRPFLFEFPEFHANYGGNEAIWTSVRDLYRMVGLDEVPLPREERAAYEDGHLGGWRPLPNVDKSLPPLPSQQHRGRTKAS